MKARRLLAILERKPLEDEARAESPDVEGWSAAGDTYADVVKLAEEGIPFALEREAELEHYVPAGENVTA